MSSGKTTLLWGLLDELDHGAGVLPGSRCGVVPQETWLRNGTLRENILAGRAFDADASAPAAFRTLLPVCIHKRNLFP